MLEARGIAKHFGAQVVLEGVDLSVARGEVVGLVGMNGSGKTTLLDILAGSTRPDSGEVWIDGVRVAHRRGLALRRQVFRSYQIPRLFYRLSVTENLLLGRWAVDGALERRPIGLPDRTNGLPASVLSAGQRRRVVLDWVRTRIGHVRYFLLDEPAAGGDIDLVHLLMDFLAVARDTACGVLLVEHRNGVLKDGCDRLVYLAEGTCSTTAGQQSAARESRLRERRPVADDPPQPRLVVRGLAVARGGACVLADVGFGIRSGEIVVVTGPNGSGKSTLLRAIYGDPSCSVVKGTITTNGRDVVGMTLRDRMLGGIHLMPQDGALFSSMAVEQVLRAAVEAQQPAAWRPEEVDRVRRALPILDRVWRRRCGLLSGGERRLVSLARLLLLRPNVALLDEPLAGVDAAGRDRVVQLIRQLADGGTAVVVAEQEALAGVIPSDSSLTLEAPRLAAAGGTLRRRDHGNCRK